MLKTTNINIDIIAISETKILKNTNVVNNINIQNFFLWVYSSWINCWKNFIIHCRPFTYQKRNDLNYLEKRYLESTFIEITNPSKTNITADCIYRHSTMDLNEFNCHYLSPFLEKLAKEQKTAFHIGDFDVDLLKYEQHKATNEFLILCYLIYSYLVLSDQLDISPIQSLLLAIFFPISRLRKQLYFSGNNLRQLNINYIRSLASIFDCTPHFFKCSQQKIQHLWPWLV